MDLLRSTLVFGITGALAACTATTYTSSDPPPETVYVEEQPPPQSQPTQTVHVTPSDRPRHGHHHPPPPPPPTSTPATPPPPPPSTPVTSGATATMRPAEGNPPPGAGDQVVTEGRPANMSQAGYYIWQEGERWMLRVATAGRERRFQGGVVADERRPQIRLAGTTTTGLSDKIIQRPRGVDFDFTASGDNDGFDYFMPSHSCARFRLKVDGRTNVGQAFVGPNATPAPASHFLLCPQGT